MIKVSDDFNNSVSKTEREMKGYVEVTFTSSDAKKNANITNFPAILKIGDNFISANGIIDDDRKGKDYASLEQDYFQLDGTFVLPNNVAEKNPGIGYVSLNTFEDDKEIPIDPFKISTSYTTSEKVNGITMYFVNNKPLQLEIQITSNGKVETFNENDCTINDKGTVQLLFSDRVVDIINIYVKDVLYQNRRIRLQEVDFGLSNIYEGEDLISFKTIEQVSRFNTEMPINECEVEIGDYTKKFDINNPKEITKYLGENVIVKPFVGVITEDSGIEYCQLGMFWLESYDADKQGVILKCKDIFNKLQTNNYIFEPDNRMPIDEKYSTIQNYGYFNFIRDEWGVILNNKVEYETDYISTTFNSWYEYLDTKINQLQKIGVFCGNTFNSNRKGEIDYISSVYHDVENIKVSKKLLKEDATIKVKKPIRNFTYKKYILTDIDTSSTEYTGVREIYDNKQMCYGKTTMYYSNEPDYINELFKTYLICDDYSKLKIIKSNCMIFNNNEDVIFDGDTGRLSTFFYVTFEYKGEVEMKISGSKAQNRTSTDIVLKYNQEGEDITIDNDIITTWSDGGIYSYNYNKIAEYINNNKSDYSINFQFNGNPVIECGDCIEVENKYPDENNQPRYDKVWVNKIQSEFKGSFNQSIEGDIIE